MIPLVAKRGVSFLSRFFHFSIFRIKVKAPHHVTMVGRSIVFCALRWRARCVK